MTVYDKNSDDYLIFESLYGRMEIKGGKFLLTVRKNKELYTWELELCAKEDFKPCDYWEDFNDFISPKKAHLHIYDGVRLCDTLEEDYAIVFDETDFLSEPFAICFGATPWTPEHGIEVLQVAVLCAVIYYGDTVDLDDIYYVNTLQSCSFGDLTGEEVYDTGRWIAVNHGKELDLVEADWLPLLYETEEDCGDDDDDEDW